MKQQVLLIVTLFLSLHFQAQDCSSLMEPVSLHNRTNEATLIIEGEVINSTSYWDTAHQNIYTIHEVTVYKNAKGDNEVTVFVETLGGIVGDDMQTTSSSASLNEGDVGVFFLKNSNVIFSNGQQTYQMVAAAQGYIRYNKMDNTATDVFNKYTSVENELYQRLELATNKKMQFVQERIVNTVPSSAFAIPVITSFTPTIASAGTGTTITISGSSFGTALGQVLFPTANNGGVTYTAAKDTQIVIWSDQIIIVKVPYTAGTGTIQVLNASGTTTSTGTLTIPYSHSNASSITTDYPRTMQSSSGGVTFDYHTDFNTSAAKPYFEQAFGLWNCESGINFAFGTTTTTDVTADDGINIVRFDNGNELPSGVLGQVTTRASQICSVTGNALAREMDITWNDDFNFYYGDGTPGVTQYDFKTVALHELGHTHQLNHIINSNNIMHYNLGPGVSKFNLSTDDIDGANYTMSVFTDASQCSAMTANSQCTFVPDDNFEAYLEANNMGNGIDGDDLVTTTNISGVTYLSVSSQGISDFTGIEDFSALETLFVFSNTMSTIDLTSNVNLKDFRCSSSSSLTTINIATLTALETLDIAGTAISTIDVSNNTALKTVWAGAAGITSLDVSNNISLDFLHISNSSITNLDLSANSVLTQFFAQNAALESLNIKNGNNTNITTFLATGNTNLGCVTVDDALYSTTNWTSVDATTSFNENCDATIYVPDDNFEAYLETHDVSGNSVSVGNVSSMGNGIANDNYVYTYRTSGVTNLAINNLGITDLTGIEAFLSIVTLESHGNSLTSINLNNNINLEYLKLGSNVGLTTINLSTLTLLKELWLYDSGLTTLDISNNIDLENLYVFNTEIDALNVSANSALIDLRCHSNNLTSLDVSNNPLLTILIAENNNISTTTLYNNNVLDILDLSGNNLTVIDVSQHIAISSLDLADNIISTLDLKTNTNLASIIVNDNELTELDVRNGNNSAISDSGFRTSGNPNLACINVDSESYSTTNWTTYVDGTSSFNEHCNETFVPDDNFENYLETHDASGNTVAVGHATSMGNGVANDNYVTTTAINTVSGLNISGLNISDLTGIETFLALETLVCNNNNLTTLDISANINLIGLYANDNGLTSINFGSITTLLIVNLSINELIDLDLTMLSNLVGLNVSNNELISLNLKNGANTLLDTNSDFYATGNQNLSCINVDDEVFSSATWQNIDSTTSFSEHCGLTYVPDDNFEQRLVDLGYDTGTLDDYVPTSLISGVTFLDVRNKSIADLTGIEGFTALETLFCDSNDLTTINTSQNIALFNLRCYGNQISSLDLSTNTNLQYLSASPNNLTTLDLEFNTALKEAFLNNNDLIALNLDTCVSLERLQVNGNNLSSLSIVNGNNINITEFTAENNPYLTCINVDDETASYLSTWSKDATASFSIHCNETYVPDDNFENYLETHDASGNIVTVGDSSSMGNGIANDDYVTTANINAVTSLNVVRKNIADLTGIADFVTLEVLSCGDNLLEELDVSQNLLLTQLYCGENQLTNLDVTQNTALIELSCFSNAIDNLDVTQNIALIEINCSLNQIENLDVTQNTALTDLECDSNQITALDVTQNIALIYFDCQNNQITSLDLTQNIVLNEFYCNENTLTYLNLKNGNNLNLDLYADQNPNLYCINVDDTSAAYLSSWTKDATASFSEHCYETYVPDDNFENYLETHDTSGNVVTIGDVSSMGNGIANDDYVTTVNIESVASLTMSNKSIVDMAGIEGFIAIETLIVPVNTFPTLDLSSNINLKALTCSYNSSLISINVSSNTLLESITCGESAIASLDLSGNPQLKYLTCDSTQITSLDLSNNLLIETIFAVNNDLIELDLSLNITLLDVNVSNNNLTEFNIKNSNNTSITGFDITSNPNLTCINVDDATYSTTNWTNIDATASYGEHCYETYVPDDIFEAYLETHDDSGNTVTVGDTASMGNGIDGDGYVTTSAIENVVSLELPYQIPGPGQVIDPATLISDLTGLEGFIALVNFDIRFQNIINLDVTENINLETLTCYDSTVANLDVSTNLQLESLVFSGNEIETLDITNNTQLVKLFATDNNITDIDLSNNTLLEEARLNFNQLSVIDFSNNTLLKEVFLNNNQLASVNLKNGNNAIIISFIATGNSNLTCVLVDDTTYSTTNWTNIDAQTSYNDVSCDLQILPKVFLQGAALNPNTGEETLMRDDLRIAGYIPTSSPYNLDSIDTAILNVTGANAIVDWVYVELRGANDNTFIVANTSALLQRDGDVVSLDGVSPVNINIPSGDYYVSIKHRNHLGIMTATTIALSSTATTVDFIDAANPITFGTDAQTTFGMPSGVEAMWAGDANGDGRLNYSGGQSDVPSIRSQVFNDPDNSVFGGPPVASYPSQGYDGTDTNLDGNTVYSGTASDVLYIRNNIFNNPSNSVFGGPPTSTYLFTQQLPEGANN